MKFRFSRFRYSSDPDARSREVKAQISSKRRHMEESRNARLELESRRTEVHRRSVDEYRRPARELRMSTWETARSFSLYDKRDFEERPLSWIAVRGTAFADPRHVFYTPGRWSEAWGELVPEPMNSQDESALAIDIDGVRIGYASARYARYAHSYVSALNSLGNRVMVPLKYRSDYARELRTLIARAFAALPTFAEFNKCLPTDDEYDKLLKPVWEALTDDVRLEISRDRFHLTERTLTELVALRHLAPEVGIPEVPRLQAVPRGVNYFLKQRRFDEYRAAERERELRDRQIIAAFQDGWRQIDVAEQLGLSTSVVNRVLKGAGVDTRSPRVNPEQRRLNDEIVSLANEGRTRREISDALDVSTRAVTKAATAAGATLRSEAGVNNYAREKMQGRLDRSLRAHELRMSGLARPAIAAQMGISDDSAKTYLSDGKFFHDPTSNPGRLAAARTIRSNGITESQVSTRFERRAIRDANMLDLIGRVWD